MTNEIMELLNKSDRAALRQILDNINTVDLAAEMEELEELDVVKLFRMLPKGKAAEVFAHLNPDIQQGIIESIADREIGIIIDELFLDDAVDFIEEMPPNVVKRVLANVTPDRRDMINRFLQYPDASAGSIMTIEYIDLTADMTVAAAFSRIQETGEAKETIYTCYVVDDDLRLIGEVSARSLLLAKPESLIGEIMEQNAVCAHTHDDRESAMNNLRKYGLLAMPVVDNEEHLVGIFTFDDAFTVQEEEATEDFEKMAAISPSDEPYLKTSVFALVKHRLPWLLFLMIFSAISGELVASFENSLAALPVLMAFIPMLMNTGGNVGNQSTTLIIRGMALDDIKLADVFRVLWTELRVSFVCGAILFVTTFLSVLIFGEGVVLAVTVSLATLAIIIMSNAIAVILTFGAKAIKLDPAVMAAPLLTNVVDIIALVVYFSLAKVIFHI